jgi:hypothetical protein
VTVRSQPGVGSTFALFLPLDRPSPLATEGAPALSEQAA